MKLHSDGKGYSTITSVRGVVKPTFRMAYNEDIIRRNPFDFKRVDVVPNDSQNPCRSPVCAGTWRQILCGENQNYIEKQYAVDTGFRMINANLINFEDTFFLENIIYNELITRGYEVFTGKTYKGEVDFVVIDGKRKCFIQVAYYLHGQETIEREFGAFKPISDASPKYVLSLDRFDYSRNGISHINIVDFLLEKRDIVLT